MNELAIRDAISSDLPNLHGLYRHLNADDAAYSLEEAQSIFERFSLYRGSSILIGEVGRETVTSCTLVVIPNLTRGGKPYALVENVVTHAEWRKRGFGSAILAAATKRAWEQGCYKVMLLTGSKNPATLAFYTQAGFEQTKTGFQMRIHGARTS
jgi:N-acetylglutamate synthase-like GNAT family acetyltransferase